MFILLCLALLSSTVYAVTPVQGTKCTHNQVINRLTVYEDGALEAECGPIPCGEAGKRCIDDQTSCRAETDVFSGMRWAANGQSVLLRCCTLKTTNKIYVGTDLVTAGSYYQGGAVAKKDLYGSGGAEYDFIANVRTEQGGVRVWVYRVMCAAGEEVAEVPVTEGPVASEETEVVEEERETEPEETESEEYEDEEEEEEGENENEVEQQVDEEPVKVEQPFNPLRYRPPYLNRASTGVKRA